MRKRRRGFVKKFLYSIVAYIHMNISPKKFLCQFAHSLWNLIVSIGRKFTADPVYCLYSSHNPKCQIDGISSFCLSFPYIVCISQEVGLLNLSLALFWVFFEDLPGILLKNEDKRHAFWYLVSPTQILNYQYHNSRNDNQLVLQRSELFSCSSQFCLQSQLIAATQGGWLSADTLKNMVSWVQHSTEYFILYSANMVF